jgi:methylmalonyl-CoA mutase C-terminal domain/subunit
VEDISLIVGGIIPVEDIPVLRKMGIAEVFLPETPTDRIVNFVRNILQDKLLVRGKNPVLLSGVV